MSNTLLFHKITSLSDSLKQELLSYIEGLLKKQKSKPKPNHAKAGCMKGTFVMMHDFNLPLSDFDEYSK